MFIIFWKLLSQNHTQYKYTFLIQQMLCVLLNPVTEKEDIFDMIHLSLNYVLTVIATFIVEKIAVLALNIYC